MTRKKEKDLPPLAISQVINIAFPVPVGSSQYFPLMVFLPSLAFISRQDIAGNSGIEPKGAAVKIRVMFYSYSYFSIIGEREKGWQSMKKI